MAVLEREREATQFSEFSKTIFESRYSLKNEEGNAIETWEDTSERVVKNVLGALGYKDNTPEYEKLLYFVSTRKFIPGGRYLYASGREFHQTQNCLLLKAEDSREGWSELLQKASMALMTGAGIGVDYSDIRPSGSLITKTGGTASGPVSLMEMLNEAGRHIMHGGQRRSAIWAGLNWKHPDCEQFIKAKDWPPEVRELKEKDFNFPATLDMTNVSVILDDEFFEAFENSSHENHELAKHIYHIATKRMVKTAEPGFSIDVGENAGETLRNAPVTAKTNILTNSGYKQVKEIVGKKTTIWTGKQWAKNVIFEKTQENANIVKVSMTGGREIRCEPNHEFLVDRFIGKGSKRKLVKTDRVKAKDLNKDDILHVSYPDITSNGKLDNSAYTMGWIYGDGSFHIAGGADLTLCSDESKLASSEIVGYNSINYSDKRDYTRFYFGVSEKWKNRSKEEFPTGLYQDSPNEIASFVAGLFDADGNWSPKQNRIRLASKHKKFLHGVQLALEQIGIMSHVSKNGKGGYKDTPMFQLVIASDFVVKFSKIIPTIRLKPQLNKYISYRKSQIKVNSVVQDGIEDVYCADVKVKEHSFMAEGIIISNCTEVTSRDDSDICNLGSINMANISDLEEFKEVVQYATLFLLAGTVYSHLPYEKVHEVRKKNRRLGLGLMGIHEWLLKRGYSYEQNEELETWLEAYTESDNWAHDYAMQHTLTVPVKTRAIAPTGTIGLIAETTTGIEPIFCAAYKRRYLGKDKVWQHQYVVDPTARRLVEDNGVNPEDIEDAYSLSYNLEKRIAFQSFVQKYVDHGISSTINLPYPITEEDELEDFKSLLYKYLPTLRGVTCYPDGARGGQPLTPASFEEAINKEGVVFESEEDNCVGGICGV
jgi:ribonucleotide reductase alpha subunit